MKISIVLLEGAKQIMMTPESDHEKAALKMIGTDDVLRVVSKWGSFGLGHSEHVSYNIAQCQGGYFRPFAEEDALMFVIKDEKKEDK